MKAFKASTKQQDEMHPPEPASSFNESSHNDNFRVIDPAYIKEVKVSGKITACHCFQGN